MYIYKTINNLNDMIYIGLCTKSIENSVYYLGSGKRLKKAIRKYGKKNFTKEILELCNNREELNNAEIKWIEFFNATDIKIGYNLHTGGGVNADDYKFSSAALEKCKIRNKKLWENPEYRKKVTDGNKEAWNNPERKEKHSNRMQQAYTNPLAIKNLKESSQNMEKLECPHCKKICKKNHAIGSHFDNCINHTDPIMRDLAIKKRNDRNKETIKKTCKYCGTIGVVGNINRWHEENCKKKGNV